MLVCELFVFFLLSISLFCTRCTITRTNINIILKVGEEEYGAPVIPSPNVIDNVFEKEEREGVEKKKKRNN